MSALTPIAVISDVAYPMWAVPDKSPSRITFTSTKEKLWKAPSSVIVINQNIPSPIFHNYTRLINERNASTSTVWGNNDGHIICVPDTHG